MRERIMIMYDDDNLIFPPPNHWCRCNNNLIGDTSPFTLVDLTCVPQHSSCLYHFCAFCFVFLHRIGQLLSFNWSFDLMNQMMFLKKWEIKDWVITFVWFKAQRSWSWKICDPSVSLIFEVGCERSTCNTNTLVYGRKSDRRGSLPK